MKPSVALVNTMRAHTLIALTSLFLVAMPAAAQLADSAVGTGVANVAFGTGTTELTVASVRVLDRAIDLLIRDPLATAVIVAPLDGSEDDAMFCLRRADVARAYLTRRGIAHYRVTVAGGGMMASRDPVDGSRRPAQYQLVIVPDDVRASSAGQVRPTQVVVRIAE